jgi:ABC-2 type transport system permease protein
MHTFWGVTYYEYRMGIRRWGMWVAFALSGLLFTGNWLDLVSTAPETTPHQWGGLVAVVCNLFTPVVGGIVIADRLVRDNKLGVHELLRSTPLSRRSYILGKYIGALLTVLTPVLATILISAGVFASRGVPVTFIGSVLAAFLIITVPAYIFIGAFSLACPAVMPVRVYQVLYTGYWFWGNFLNPQFMPTVSGSLLTAKGDYAANAFFNVPGMYLDPHTPIEAVLNIAVLVACAAAALFVLERYLAWQERSY